MFFTWWYLGGLMCFCSFGIAGAYSTLIVIVILRFRRSGILGPYRVWVCYAWV